jgi:hypothetical protein
MELAQDRVQWRALVLAALLNISIVLKSVLFWDVTPCSLLDVYTDV